MVLGLIFVVARRSSALADERAVTLALAASLLLTPILWLHYFLLLFLPLALFHKRFTPVWLVPLAFWLTPFQESGGEVWRIAFAWLILALVFGLSLGRARIRSPAHSGREPVPAPGAADWVAERDRGLRRARKRGDHSGSKARSVDARPRLFACLPRVPRGCG